MRKVYALALLSLAVAASLFAYKFDMDNRILIGSGNDRYTMGISKNYDDALSFNYAFDFQNEDLHLMAYLNGYTDRVAGTGHDELLLLGSWNFKLLRQGRFMIDVMPSAGLDVDGYLGFEDFQNAIHRIFDIPQLRLNYPDETNFGPYGDILFSARYGITDDLRIGLCLNGQYWDSFRLNASLALQYRQSGFMIGYNGSWNTDLRLDLGLLVINHRSDLESRTGFGTISVDAMSFFRERKWKNSDVYISFGKSFLQSFVFTAQQTVQTIKNWPIDVTIYNRYFTGNPPNSKLDVNQRVIRHHNQIAAGFSYSFPEVWIFTPFVELAGGVAIWKMEYINLDGGSKVEFPNLTTAFAIFRAGTDILKEGTIVLDSTTLMIDAAIELNYFFDADKITDYVRKDKYHDSDYVFNSFCVSFTIGFTFGLDVY